MGKAGHSSCSLWPAGGTAGRGRLLDPKPRTAPLPPWTAWAHKHRLPRKPHRLRAGQSRAWASQGQDPRRRPPQPLCGTSHGAVPSAAARPQTAAKPVPRRAAARVSPAPRAPARGPRWAPLPCWLSAVPGVCSLSPCAFSRQVRGYHAAPSSRTFSACFLRNPQQCLAAPARGPRGPASPAAPAGLSLQVPAHCAWRHLLSPMPASMFPGAGSRGGCAMAGRDSAGDGRDQ